MAALVAATGGWQTPYYLYVLSPLLAAAFFFQLRGALLATTTFLLFYGVAIAVEAAMGATELDPFAIVTALAGFYLLSGTFGYAATLFRQLQAAQDEAARAHQDLAVLHRLTAALHSAADVEEVQDQVLTAITAELGLRRAVVGLVDENETALSGWLGHVRAGETATVDTLSHPARLPLSAEEGGLIARALLEQRICRASDEVCTANEWMRTHFGLEGCPIFPLLWGIRPVGVLLVDGVQEEDDERRRSLEAIAQQTAAVLGMMNARLRRARESAVQEERARIAQEMHDTISQALFGLVYTLDGSLKLLPDDPEAIRTELEWALQTAEGVRREVRQAITEMWSGEEITAPTFEADLRRYVADVLQGAALLVDFDVRGDFAALSPRTRRSLYRIAQEALANVVHHAAAQQARVCVDVAAGRARLVVRDDGRGFEPEVALAQEHGREHFGLRGMQARAASLGGTCDVFSRPGAGTSIAVDVAAGVPGTIRPRPAEDGR